MMSYLFIISICLPLSFGISWEDEITLKDYNQVATYKNFQHFSTKYNKIYASIEQQSQKFAIFTQNLKIIATHNTQANNSFKLRANQFVDMSQNEFNQFISNGIHTYTTKLNNFISFNNGTNPVSVDWRTQNVITPVGNEGECGSTWAWTAVDVMSCNYAIKTGELNILSVQELVDCCQINGSDGCNGGWMNAGMEYAAENNGLCSAEEYPYTAQTGVCKADKLCQTRYDPPIGKGYKLIVPDSEIDLENAVVQGCVSVAIEADQQAFQFYSSGIISGPCGASVDHGVAVIGYGIENSKKYWIVKNQWGTSWGEQGYARICKECNKNGNKGECGILQEPSVSTY